MVGLPIRDVLEVPSLKSVWTPLPFYDNIRYSTVMGGYQKRGNRIYINAILKLNFLLPAVSSGNYYTGHDINARFANPVEEGCVYNLDCFFMKKNAESDSRYIRVASGGALAYNIASPSVAEIAAWSPIELDGTNSLFYAHICGYFDVE